MKLLFKNRIQEIVPSEIPFNKPVLCAFDKEEVEPKICRMLQEEETSESFSKTLNKLMRELRLREIKRLATILRLRQNE